MTMTRCVNEEFQDAPNARGRASRRRFMARQSEQRGAIPAPRVPNGAALLRGGHPRHLRGHGHQLLRSQVRRVDASCR